MGYKRCEPVGLGNSKISTNYVQNFPRHTGLLERYPYLQLHALVLCLNIRVLGLFITQNIIHYCIRLFRSRTMLCGTDIILHNIVHIHIECDEYSTKYFQSNRTLSWIWIMLCVGRNIRTCILSFWIYDIVEIFPILKRNRCLDEKYQNWIVGGCQARDLPFFHFY